MTGNRLRAAGLGAALALLAPSLATVIVSLHLIVDHHDHVTEHVVNLETLLHGHRHTQAAPDHAHVVAPRHETFRLSSPASHPLVGEALRIAGDSSSGSGSAASRPQPACTGPPAPGARLSVLRI